MAYNSCFNRLEIYTKDLDKVWNKDKEEVDFSILIPMPNENAFNSKIESQDEDKTVITFFDTDENGEFFTWINALRENNIEFSIYYCEQETGKKSLKAYVDGHLCQTDGYCNLTKEILDNYTIENLKRGIKDEFESGYKYNILLKESWAKAEVLHAVEIEEEMETIGKDKAIAKEKGIEK